MRSNQQVIVYVLDGSERTDENPKRILPKGVVGLENVADGQNTYTSPPKVGHQQSAARVAIVDDDKLLVQIYQHAIHGIGYKEEFVGYDGSEIVEAIASNQIHPDVILMDHRMSRMSGLEAAQRIRKMDKSVRIIVATADDSIIEEAREFGLETIQKPFSLAELRRILERPGSNSISL